MNAHVMPRPGLDAFHRERSKCIDAFAALEEAVVRILDQAGLRPGREPFGAKLDMLRKVKACPAISKRRVAAIQQIAQSCEKVTEIRNDIVHSRLQLATINDEIRAASQTPAFA